VQLGDEMNGFVAERKCKTASEAAEFLDWAAREHFPSSAYALGKEDVARPQLGSSQRSPERVGQPDCGSPLRNKKL
jgi:hypothetical protein